MPELQTGLHEIARAKSEQFATSIIIIGRRLHPHHEPGEDLAHVHFIVGDQ